MRNLHKLIVLVLILVLGGLILFRDTDNSLDQLGGPTDKAETATGDEEIKIAHYKVGSGRQIDLFSNFPDTQTASSAYKDLGCDLLTSAGYYTPAGKNLGLMIIDGQTLTPPHASSLLNGYIYYSQGQTTFSSGQIATFASQKYDFALQAGPLVLLDNKKISLTNANEESARRVLLGKSSSGEIYFFAIYNTKSLYMGATIQEVPGLITDFEKENAVDIVDLLNLDGGSASAYITKDLKLTELKPIGGYFCVR